MAHPKLHWVSNEGGIGGGNEVLMLGNKYIGHFYIDASDGVDAEEVLNEMVEAYNNWVSKQ